MAAQAPSKGKTVYHLKATLTDWEARVRGMPYRVIAIPPERSLYELAEAITDAFGFSFDHAFGFYNKLKNPYDSSESYELFSDLEEEEGDNLGFIPSLPQLAELVPGGEDDPAFLVTKAAMELDHQVLQARYLEATRAILREEVLARIPAEKHAVVQPLLQQFIQAMVPTEEDLKKSLSLDEPEAKGVKGVPITEAFPKVGKKMLFLFDYGDEWRFIVELKAIEPAEPRVRYPKVVQSVGEAPEQYPGWDEEDEG
ncbi:IS1096 element passenger TnpR family protein [Calidithermus roseus]|uniref:Plasmid pRiA4b ORF-3-like protein n=1 Tax=Calidithermus roseus TaxID=1644118 RepID=A0A399EXZ0_9DEIN|nr:hypothetical protein [Calidithermus roseus]RIH89477.1 Plasmid pRiA4b ORF-3-like protein [Calidithermus roseus]